MQLHCISKISFLPCGFCLKVCKSCLRRSGYGDPGRGKREKKKRRKIRRFHELLTEGYEEAYPENPGIITAKLKELWFYLGDSFPGTVREQKTLKKARTPEELIRAAEAVMEG